MVPEQDDGDRRKEMERRLWQVGGAEYIDRLAENLRSEVKRQPPDEAGVSHWTGLVMGAVGALVATGDIDPDQKAAVQDRLLAPLVELGAIQIVHREAEKRIGAPGQVRRADEG
jgi:hypothetical protein